MLPARLSRPALLVALLLLGHALAHFGLGWALGLSGDEAHYALYAAHPALSYYDHPPLVGWVQWPLVVLGAPDGVLRLLPEALWLATAWLVHAIACRLQEQAPVRAELVEAHAGQEALRQAQGERGYVQSERNAFVPAGWWAVLAYSLSPLLHVLGIGLLPDTLLMFFTAALMLQTLRMLDAGQARRLRAWLLLGALLGLAGLAKYTAIFAALPVAACLLAVHGARLLRRPAPWLALALAVALVLQVFVWNAQHGWISFAYQLQHGAGSQWRAGQMLGFLLLQGLLYPLLLWGVWAWLRSLQGAPVAGRAVWLLSFFALPFAVLAYLSGGGSGLPHWTAPAWVALAPFAGLGLSALWASGRRRVIWLLGGVQALLCIGLYALMLSAGPTWLESRADADAPEAINPFTDFYGWDEAGARARRLARESGTEHLAVQNWTLASRLAWYARPLPVHVLAPGFDQFSLWSGELPHGASAVLLDWSQMAYRLPVGAEQFERCTPLESWGVQRAGRAVAHFALHHCTGWGGRSAPQRVQ